MGSNPTPRAYLGGLYKNNKKQESKDLSRKTRLTYRELAFDQEEKEKQEIAVLHRKIDSITKTCSKLFLTKH